MATSFYRMPWFYRPMILGLLAVFSLVDVLWWVMSATGSAGPGWLFTFAWTAVLGHLARTFLWQMVYELRLEGGALSWKTPLRSGAFLLPEVRAFRPWRVSRNIELIRFANGTALMVLIWKGFSSFADDVAKQSPHVPVRVSPFMAQLYENWPFQGRGGYERRE